MSKINKAETIPGAVDKLVFWTLSKRECFPSTWLVVSRTISQAQLVVVSHTRTAASSGTRMFPATPRSTLWYTQRVTWLQWPPAPHGMPPPLKLIGTDLLLQADN